jgi:shikimate 5-dehydrogenase
VTIPLKESVIPELDALSDVARKIGAVNTITKLRDGSLFGDNTDWLGIKAGLESRRLATAGSVGLICGAGGTARAACHALQQMCVGRVLILNPRTPSRADAVAAEFGNCDAVVDGVVSCAAHGPPLAWFASDSTLPCDRLPGSGGKPI